MASSSFGTVQPPCASTSRDSGEERLDLMYKEDWVVMPHRTSLLSVNRV